MHLGELIVESSKARPGSVAVLYALLTVLPGDRNMGDDTNCPRIWISMKNELVDRASNGTLYIPQERG